MEKNKLKSQLYKQIERLEMELSSQLGRSAYSVEKPLQKELDKLWEEVKKLD